MYHILKKSGGARMPNTMKPSIPETEFPNYRWIVLGLWLFCTVYGFMVLTTFGVLLPAISSELHLSPSQQGLLSSAAFWGNLTLAIPLSWLTARYPAKMLTTVTLVIGILLLFLQSWAPSFFYLLVGRLGFGITLIARIPARALLTRQWFPQKEIVLVNSLGNIMFGIVLAGGLIATPFILSTLGDNWRINFRIFGFLLIGLTFLWVTLGKDRPTIEDRTGVERSTFNPLKTVLNYRDLWIAGIGFLGVNLPWAAFLSFFPTLMLDTYGLSLQWSGGILALAILTGGISGVGFGYLSMTTQYRKGILQILGVLMVLSYIAMTQTSSLPVLLVLSFLNGLSWGFWPILYTVPFQLPGIHPRDIGIALAFIMMMISVGTVLGPLAAGLLQESVVSLKTSLLILSCFSLSLSFAGTFLRKT